MSAPFLRLVLTLALLTGGTVRAEDLQFRPLGEDRGLEASVIAGVVVDHAGFLWVGTREGLFRYDGYQAVPFMPGPNGSNTLSDADVRLLYLGPDGTLWIATNTGGLNRHRPGEGFESWRHDSADPGSISYDSVYGIAQDDEGFLWVGTQVGLNRMDPESGRFERFLHDPGDPTSLSNDYVYPVLNDPEGRVWVGTVGGGVNLRAPGQGGFERFSLAAMLDGGPDLDDVFALAWAPGRGLYAGTRGGLVLLDPGTGTAQRVELPQAGEVPPAVSVLELDQRQRLWIGTLAEGVLVLDLASGEARPASNAPLGTEGQLPVVPVLSMHVRGQDVFVGTWGGGAYLARVPDREVLHLRDMDDETGLRHRTVTSVLGTATDGRPWVGTFGGGLQRADVEGGRADAPPADEPGLGTAGVMAIVQMADGRLFAGSTDGLWEIDPATGSAHLYRGGAEHGLGAGYVTALLTTPGGDLWVGVGGTGLHLLRAGERRFARYAHQAGNPASLSGDFITDLELDENGMLWVGTRSNGLNRCRPAPFECTRLGTETGLGHHHVTDLYRDRGGRLWVASDGGGLQQLRWDETTGRADFAGWGRDDGLLSDALMGIVEDDDGSLWLTSREGLSRFNPGNGQVENLVPENGLPTADFSGAAASRDATHLYFGALQGLVSVPVGTPMRARSASPVRLSSLERPAGRDGPQRLLDVPGRHAVPWGEVLTVEFAVLDFAQVPHQYAYRLEDDSPWIELGTRRDMSFFGLPAGQHRFSVRGRDVFGGWNQSPVLELDVIPPFWRTTWFRLLVLLALLSLTWALHRARLNALEKRHAALQRLQVQREKALEAAEQSRAELEQAYAGLRHLTARLESAKEDERREISRELHDELGQTLTAAKINLQMLRKQSAEGPASERLEEAVGMLDGMIQQVRNISLSLRPPLLDEAGLVPALAYYVDSLAERSGLAIELDSDPGVPGNPPEVRTTVFRIVQEALSNVLRHAQASTVRVVLRSEPDALRVMIEDDGRGFDTEAVQLRVQRGEHLGLLGMAERVRAAGGQFTLHSEPGKGSRVEARIPRPAPEKR